MATDDRTSERHEGPTPAGGAYSVAHFFDADGRPCPHERAVEVEIVEYDTDGGHVFRTYGNMRPTVRLEVLDHARLLWTPDSMRGTR